MPSETVELRGHIIDSLILPKVLDEILTRGGSFKIGEIKIGQNRVDQSYARVELSAASDEVLGDIAVQAPTTLERLGHLRSLPKGFERSKWGEAIVEAVNRGVTSDPKTLPQLERSRGVANGGATVELLKVLLRMTSERHAVASKIIATVDDLEQIAADDNADVGALRGWRRELFGEAALALKHGRLALAIEKGRVIRVDRN